MKLLQNKKLIFICAIAVLIPPIIIAIFVSLPILPKLTNSNDWIGFWGGYVGSIFGGIITLIVLQKTLKSNEETLNRTLSAEKDKENYNRKLAFFDNVCESLLCLSTDMVSSLCEGDEESEKRIHISLMLLKAKLKSKQNEYIDCAEMLNHLLSLNETFNDILAIKLIDDEATEWDEINLSFMEKVLEFDNKVARFYTKNFEI